MAAVVEHQTGRRRVLDAAAGLFVAQGYAGTTLREIAAAAGIKAGSIYHHFDSKEALFVAVLDDGMQVMMDAFAETSTGLGDSPSVGDELGAHVRAHLTAVFVNGPYTTAHVTSFFSAPEEVRTRVVPVRDAYEKKWTGLFRRLFPDLSRREQRLHRLILFGAMNASAEWFDPSGDVAIGELAALITDQFLTGVQPQ